MQDAVITATLGLMLFIACIGLFCLTIVFYVVSFLILGLTKSYEFVLELARIIFIKKGK